jgi:hypothetical protein
MGLLGKLKGNGETARGSGLFPPTQEHVLLYGVKDGVLVLRDHTLAVGVGMTSVDLSLLDPDEAEAKVLQYRAFLETLRFPVQIVVGTRPQDLEGYLGEIEQLIIGHERATGALQQTRDTIAGWQTGEDVVDLAFLYPEPEAAPLPYPAGKSAAYFRDRVRMRADGDRLGFEKWLTRTVDLLDERLSEHEHRLRLLYGQAEHAQAAVDRVQAPVRTFYWIIAHNPRMVETPLAGPLTRREFDDTKEVLEGRAAKVIAGLRHLGLAVWRATTTELVGEIFHFYHPPIPLQARITEAFLKPSYLAFRDDQPLQQPDSRPVAPALAASS